MKLVLGTTTLLLGLAGAQSGDRGDTKFRNGQDASVSFTAGGTSKPCTGLYCQDNPLGNPCPCPVAKPCKHLNMPDSHCMYRVDINGTSRPDAECTPVDAAVLGEKAGAIQNGTWSATIAGWENTGEIASGHCLCTAGSADVYESSMWGNCNATSPQWCDKLGNGNACPPMPCSYFWTEWAVCSKSCGGGLQTRTPLVSRQPKNGGKECPAAETRKCNVKQCDASTPTPAPAAPTPSNPKCPSKKLANKHLEAHNLAMQVQNMKEGLKAAKSGCRDTRGEKCNRVHETQNLLEEQLNTPLLSCAGKENCNMMTMSSTHVYSK
jgi:hypothetical protein